MTDFTVTRNSVRIPAKRIADYSVDPTDDEVLFQTDSGFRVLHVEPSEGDRPLTIRSRGEE